VDGRAPALPARVRLEAPPRDPARWSLDGDGTLHVTLVRDGSAPTTLVLRAADGGWSGTASDGAHPATVTLARATDCDAR
jgi:hypothetical protein